MSTTQSPGRGETAKNLVRLVDVADAFDSVLLFNEADALFGRCHRVRWRTRQSHHHTGFAGLSEDGTGLADTSPSLMFGGVHQNQQLQWIRMKDQIEQRRPDLFRTPHTDLDSNVPVDDAVNRTSTCVWTEREHDIIRGGEPFSERRLEDMLGVGVVLPHNSETTPAICFPALDLKHQPLAKLASSLSEQDADTDRLRP